jgi:hypothetical protein
MSKKNRKNPADEVDPLLDPEVETEVETETEDPAPDPENQAQADEPRELTLAEINAIHREADRQAREAKTKGLSDAELIIHNANEEAGKIISAAKIRADGIIQAALMQASQSTK